MDLTAPPVESSACAAIAAPMKKRDWSRQLKRSTIEVQEHMDTTDGTSQKKQQKADTASAKPEASEQEWQDRFRKRQDGINHMKSSPIYYEHQDHPHKLLKLHKRSRTPDVYNRDFSKRNWEEKAAKWRASWRAADGVAKLVEIGYPEKRSREAWKTAGERIEKAQEELRRKQKKNKKENKKNGEVLQEPKQDHSISQDQAHKEHKEQAIAILCS